MRLSSGKTRNVSECGTSSSVRHSGIEVLFCLPVPPVGNLGHHVFRMTEKQDGEGLLIHIRLSGIKTFFKKHFLLS